MRILSFILAFGFVLVGPSMAGPINSSVPGIGAFSYAGSVVVAAPAVRVAAR